MNANEIDSKNIDTAISLELATVRAERERRAEAERQAVEAEDLRNATEYAVTAQIEARERLEKVAIVPVRAALTGLAPLAEEWKNDIGAAFSAVHAIAKGQSEFFEKFINFAFESGRCFSELAESESGYSGEQLDIIARTVFDEAFARINAWPDDLPSPVANFFEITLDRGSLYRSARSGFLAGVHEKKRSNIAAWAAENVSSPSMTTTSEALVYEAYRSWCVAHAEQAVELPAFGATLSQLIGARRMLDQTGFVYSVALV